MATIVRDRHTGKSYILIGAGFGAYHSMKPHWFFGNLASQSRSGEVTVIAVCDAKGRVGWLDSEDVEVVQVDGSRPADLLGSLGDDTASPPRATPAE